MSTLKVDTLNTRTGSGNITFSRPTVLTAGDIVTADIAADAIDGTKLADNACDSEHYTDGSIDEAHIANDAVNFITHLKAGTDGELITWDASGNPAAVAVGTAAQVLTSAGVGLPPVFAAAAGGGATFSLKRASRNMTTASGNQDFTGMGFQPIAALVMCAAEGSHDQMMSIGWKDFVSGATGCCYTDRGHAGWKFYYVPTAQMEWSASGYRQVASCTALSTGVRLSWVSTNNLSTSRPYGSFVMGMK